ncbi:recombinase family protein [Halioxenophilus aromaticivorans]|uniref:Recombinase family protein n=1 Tax=Halioxenophilus aromaticivorans TaxID=1306992 RepID=A0AAV3U2E2_9ALTE
MAVYGYARVSSVGQSLEIQQEALARAGCSVIRSEKVSGTSRQGREELERLLEFVTEGDILVVTRIDRLARSMRDLQDIFHELKSRGACLRATEQSIDTSSPEGKAFADILGVFSEFETALRKERQMEGIAKAKAEGRYLGRKATARAKSEQVLNMRQEGIGPTAIARQLGISRASVYRIIGKK